LKDKKKRTKAYDDYKILIDKIGSLEMKVALLENRLELLLKKYIKE